MLLVNTTGFLFGSHWILETRERLFAKMYWLKIRFVAHASPTVHYMNESFVFEKKISSKLAEMDHQESVSIVFNLRCLNSDSTQNTLQTQILRRFLLAEKKINLWQQREIIAESAIPSLIKDLWNLRIYLWTKPLIEATLLQIPCVWSDPWK